MLPAQVKAFLRNSKTKGHPMFVHLIMNLEENIFSISKNIFKCFFLHLQYLG